MITLAVSSPDNIFKVLEFPLSIFSILGIVYLVKNRKAFIVVLSIIIFSTLWRLFSYSDSSRYYSTFIIYGFFLMGYGAIRIIYLSRSKSTQQMLIFILVASLLYINTITVFGSFNNKYLFDVHEMLDLCWKKDSHCCFFITPKEYKRIRQNFTNIKGIPTIINVEDMHDLCISEGLFGRDVYFVNQEENNNLEKQKGNKLLTNKIANFIRNSNHDKSLSIYKHKSFVPSPNVNIEQLYKDAVLKAYFPEYSAFIYHVDNKIIWLIGKTIEPKTEIIFQLFTTKPELLPQNRIKYKFDNLGFHYNGLEQKRIGMYLVFEKIIPSAYPVTLIRVGFYSSDEYFFHDFPLYDDMNEFQRKHNSIM